MAGHTTQLDAKTLWGGKESPFQTSYGKLMMWFFLVSDALTFSGLLIAYGFTRHDAQDAWPIGEETFNSMPFLGHGYPLLYVALMTFILIVSSVTMVLAVEAGHRMDRKGVTNWMIATIIGGFFFVGSQAWEWSHFIHGSEFGKIELADGSQAIVKGHFGEIKNFTVIETGKHHKVGEVMKEDLMHEFQHAAEKGHLEGGNIHFADGTVAKINKFFILLFFKFCSYSYGFSENTPFFRVGSGLHFFLFLFVTAGGQPFGFRRPSWFLNLPITEGVLTLYKIKHKVLKVYRLCITSIPSCTIVQA